ncbi:MAG: recombinase RecA [Deltaproteobacteria bacterium]|nr:recombinase RecA [Deltaproteobacteria bacterium]
MAVKLGIAAVDDLIRSIEKAFGRGTLMVANGEAVDKGIEVTPSGSFALDRALGTGGVPKGRIIEIYGPEASGKTTMALSVLAQAQRAGGLAAFVDAEHALDLRYARRLGVDCARMLLSQPDCGEQAMDVVEALVRSGQVDVVVVDSVAALVPKAEIDGEMGDNHVGLQARLMSRAMRKLASLAHQTGTTLIFINQIRMKIGVTMGSPETTTGGNALKFYASVRLDVRRIGSLKKDDRAIGNRVKIKVVKNKLAPPFREAEIDLLFGSGFCREGEVFDLAVAQGVVSRSGAFYRLGDELVGQGRDRAITEMKARPDLCARIEAQLVDDSGELCAPELEEAA